MEEAAAALGLDLKIIIIQGVGFLILLWLLKKYLFGPIQEIAEKRRQDVAGTYEKAEKTQREVEGLRKDYEALVANIDSEATEKMEQALKQARAMAQEILAKTRQEADEMRRRATYDISQEKKKALAEIRDEVVHLSMHLTRKMIEKSMDQETAEKLVDDFIDQSRGIGS